MTFWKWSRTASANANADTTINWAEGQPPSSVNDSGRAMMAAAAKYRDDTAGVLTGGAETAYTVATAQGFANALANLDGASFTIIPHVTSGAAPTLAVDGLAAKPIRIATGSDMPAGALLEGTPYRLTYSNDNEEFLVHGALAILPPGAPLSDDAVSTGTIADKAVTLRKLYHPSSTSRILGSSDTAAKTITGAANNGSGLIRLTMSSATGFATGQKKTVSDVQGTTEANGTWTITVVDETHVDLQGSTFSNVYLSGGTIGGGVEEISIGAGLVLSGNALSAPAIPALGSYKNLSIKVTGNTTATVQADFVVLSDGTNYQTRPVNATLNMTTTGANGLDTGSIASATWYAIFAIAKPDGTTAVLASTSSTAPTLPSGYTYVARIGFLRTAAGTAQLMGTWQLGRAVQYVVGLAQTSALPTMSSGNAGSISSPTWVAVSVSSFVPPTASRISFTIGAGSLVQYFNGFMAAPNSSYGALQNVTNPPPVAFRQSNSGYNECMWLAAEFLLESANIYWAMEAINNGKLMCRGWEDNI